MDTHLSQLYDTNHVPSDTELLEIKRLLSPPSVQLRQLERDLEEAEATVARLKRQREDVLRVMKPLKALSSLIRRFPREAMELIFMHSIPTGRATSSICNAPLVLLRVCRSWREIALTTPRLWKSVDLSIPLHLFPVAEAPPDPKTEQRLALFVEQTDQWLKRSQSCPLSVALHGSPHNGGTISKLASKLAVHSSRWESIDFDVSVWPGISSITIQPDSLPALKHLRFSTAVSTDPFGDADRPVFGDGIFAAAHLKTLHLQVSHSFRRYLTMPINWANLTCLSLEDVHMFPGYRPPAENLNASDMLPILKKCRNLRILSLLLRPSFSPYPTDPESHVTLPSLEALKILGCKFQIHFLLQSIETPSIREVQYQPFNNYSSSSTSLSEALRALKPANPLTSFLRRYGHQMEVLLISIPSISEDDFGSWLECTPVLKQLTIGNPAQFGHRPSMRMHVEALRDLDGRCIEMLIPKQGQPYLCPNLKIFRCTVKSRISGDTILAFLTSRTFLTDRCSRIEEMLIHELPYDNPFGEMTGEGDERLKPIREAGVRLSFRRIFYYQINRVPTIPDSAASSTFGPGYGADFRFF